MDWTRPIDAYCERTGPEFWAEPLNAATNIAFLLAALVALVLARRAGRLDGPVAFLTAVTAAVGVGSFVFHTVASVWASLADTVPILVFILGYFAVAMNRFAGFGWGRSALLTLGFLAGMAALARGLSVTIGAFAPPSYVPALVAMLSVGLWLGRRGHAAGRWLVAAALVFAVSLTLRTLDAPLCEAWPSGTHLFWHLLNGVVLGVLLIALIRHGRLPRGQASHT